jgi:hypothetical protein
MKKRLGTILIGSLSIMLLLGGCNINFGVGESNSSRSSGSATKIDESYDMANVKSIVINTEISNCSIDAYDGDKIKITGTIGSESKGIDYSLDGDKATVKEEYNKSIIGINGNGDDDISKYKILIPNNYNGDVAIEYGAGSMNIQGIKADNINLKGGAGELDVKDIVFNNLNLSSGVGAVNLSLEKKCGNINIEGGVGKTVLRMKEVGGNLKANGGIGSIDIEVPENAPIYFKTSSGVGSNDISNVKTSGEKTYLFELSVGVGEIKVHN